MKESEDEDEEGELQSIAVCRIFDFMHLTNLVLASAVNMKVDLSSFGEMRLGGPYVHSGCLPGKVVCFYFLQLN